MIDQPHKLDFSYDLDDGSSIGLIGLCLAALSGSIVGVAIGAAATLLWLAS